MNIIKYYFKNKRKYALKCDLKHRIRKYIRNFIVNLATGFTAYHIVTR